jgi:hypothetical protein
MREIFQRNKNDLFRESESVEKTRVTEGRQARNSQTVLGTNKLVILI